MRKQRFVLQGFSKQLYPYYPGYPSTLDPSTGLGKDGNVPGKDVLKNITILALGGQRPIITTPMVQKHVRKFFNCTTLQGAEVEGKLAQGSDASILDHWDQRLFEVCSHQLLWNELTQRHL
jgi:hypothetical protein